MATNTKTLIYDTFIELLKEKPFDRITVRDIVEKCNINRNTFYYHYADIYELLDEIFRMEVSEINSPSPPGRRWLVGLIKLLESCYSNKKIINNICASRSYDYLESYLYKSGRKMMSEFVREKVGDRDVDDESLEFIISFFQYAVTGVISEWFRTGMRETPRLMLRRLYMIMDDIPAIIERAPLKKK